MRVTRRVWLVPVPQFRFSMRFEPRYGRTTTMPCHP
jgi:hypothetical protein